MSEQARGSLADEVADWTPPWQRERPAEDGADGPRVDVEGCEVRDGDEPAAETGDAGPAETAGEPGEPDEAVTPVTAPMVAGDPETADVPDAADGIDVVVPEAGPAGVDVGEVDVEADAVRPESETVAIPEVVHAEVGVGETPDEAAEPEAPAVPVPGDGELPAVLEAILMVVDEPVGEVMLAQILERPAAEITGVLERLSAEYTEQGRGFDLRRQAGGWRFYTRDDYAAQVERFVLDGQQARLTKAALETLAVVAYKQPVTRARISGIRGVNCDGVVRTLLSRGLVEECGAEPETGAHLYRTTVLFLEKLGINSIDELPPLAPFLPDDLDDLTDGARDDR